MKQILFGNDFKEKALIGFNRLADTIGLTLGPKARYIFVDDALLPRMVDDGETIAKETVFEDKFENAGAWFIRNTASQTGDKAGDGTSTTTVVLQSLVNEAQKTSEHPRVIADSIEKASKEVLKKIKKASKPVKEDQIEQIARISCGHDELAKIISDIVKKQGKEVLFMVEDNKGGVGITSETIEGYEANVGYISPVFITDLRRGRAIHEEIPVLVSQKKISNLAEVQNIFEQLKASNMNRLVIVAEEVDEGMLSVFAATHLKRAMSLLIVKATGPLLEDIGGAVGASLISNHTGITFQNFDIGKHLGAVKKVVSDQHKTLFVPLNKGRGEQYANLLEGKMAAERNQFLAQRLKERIAKLRSGVAVIKIAAATDTEREFLKLKADDATKAVICALEEGIVEGGGMCLWRIAKSIKGDSVGERILKKALSAPLKKICENGDKDYTEIVINMPEGQGYDAKNEVYTNMLEAGIIDPAKVERMVIENSVSTACKFIVSGAGAVEHTPLVK